MMVLITYDIDTSSIDGGRRLRQVAKECVNYGHRVQNSVFECEISEIHYKLLFEKIKSIIDKEKDSVRFYFLGKNWRHHIKAIGKDNSLDMTGILIF